MHLPSLVIAASAAILLVEIVAGIVMGIEQNCTLAPAMPSASAMGSTRRLRRILLFAAVVLRTARA